MIFRRDVLGNPKIAANAISVPIIRKKKFTKNQNTAWHSAISKIT